MKIQALNDRILIRVHSDNTKLGLILPDGVQLNPHGEVIAVGPKVESCLPGDRILMDPNSPMQVTHEGEVFWFIMDHNVIGKYVDDILE